MDPNNCRNVTDAVEVNGESIVSVVKEEDWFKKQRSRVKVIDYGKVKHELSLFFFELHDFKTLRTLIQVTPMDLILLIKSLTIQKKKPKKFNVLIMLRTLIRETQLNII